jgi:hypothetical protein
MTASVQNWPGSRALLAQDASTKLDIDASVGQRQATFRFDLTNGVSGENLGTITPIRQPATLSHDTTSTTKRRLSIALGKADFAAVNPLTDRISPYMVFPGFDPNAFPLGRYMFTAPQGQLFATQQRTGSIELSDEMFLVDQLITRGVNGNGVAIPVVILNTLAGLPIEFDFDATPYASAQAWGVGSGRGQILEALALAGDYWSPWFGNDTRLHFERTFDPAKAVPDLDLDLGARVVQGSIVETTEILTAPNVFIVISNGGRNSPTGDQVVGIAQVPPSSPNSVANRGFEIPQQMDVQLTDPGQAQAVANGLAQRQTIFEQVTLTTALDPRHDSYDVIRWQGANWLELAWSMQMVEGGNHTHTLRKSYAT